MARLLVGEALKLERLVPDRLSHTMLCSLGVCDIPSTPEDRSLSGVGFVHQLGMLLPFKITSHRE